jgi:hypothetical protein
MLLEGHCLDTASDSGLLCFPYQNNHWVHGVCVPVRIQVRIHPSHPLVCRKRRLNGTVLWMRPEKPRSRVTAGVAR